MTKLTFQKTDIGIGKRKQAVARVFLVPGKGEIMINKVTGNKYLQYNDTYIAKVWAPLKLVKCDTTLDIIAFVKGGGLTGQSEAIQLGVSRQLCKIDEKHRITLKPLGFLTRDSRNKERKKYGLRKARKAPQYSKR